MTSVAPRTPAPTADRRFVRREVGLVLLTLLGYFGLRLVVEGDPAVGERNAERLLELERSIGLDVEQAFQQWVLDHDVVRWVLSTGYVWLHWPLLIAAMGYLTWRAPAVQVRLRRAIALSAAVGIVLFASVPMAPPRFMTGYVGTVSDAARRHYLPYSLDWTNQYAAFPSYHVGWTLLACLAVAQVVRHPGLRLLVLAPAVVVAASVVGTGNHYVLDSVTGASLALAAWFAVASRPAQAGSETTVTVPVPPSTRTTAPSGMREVASVAATTQGRPSSRETMTAWLICPPTSTTTASTGTNSGVHDGSVSGATRTSPGPSSPGSPGSVTMRATPSATPGQPPRPEIDSPTASDRPRRASSRNGHVSAGGSSPSKTKGGTRRASSSRTRRRSAIVAPNGTGSVT